MINIKELNETFAYTTLLKYLDHTHRFIPKAESAIGNLHIEETISGASGDAFSLKQPKVSTNVVIKSDSCGMQEYIYRVRFNEDDVVKMLADPYLFSEVSKQLYSKFENTIGKGVCFFGGTNFTHENPGYKDQYWRVDEGIYELRAYAFGKVINES